MRWLAVATGMVLAAAGTAFGDPLAGSSLPAKTRWVIHVDVEGARAAKPLWDAAQSRLGDLPRAALMPQLAVLERVTSMKVPQELKDVTLYNASFDEDSTCVRIHGKMDAGLLESFLKTDKEFKQITHGAHTIMQWRDKTRDRLMYVSFAQPDLAVLSAKLDGVERSLDTLDRKEAGLQADSPLAPAATGSGSREMVWLAATGLDAMPLGQNQSPVLTQVESASIGVRWANDRVVTDMRVTAKSEKVAQQLKAVAEGIKAFVELSGADEHAPPALRLLAGTMEQVTVQTDGKTLNGRWPVGIDKIDMLLNVVLLEKGASTTKAATTTTGSLP